MKREEAIEIADKIYMSPPWTNSAEERIVMLCNEVERRTLERAAVVCDATAMCHGLALGSKEDKEMRGAKNCASSIRALKEEGK